MELSRWGIDDGYWDASGNRREVPSASLEAIATAMGAGPGVEEPPPPPPMWFVRAGRAESLLSPAHIVLEEGSRVRVTDALPRDLPIGYHDLVPDDGGPTTRLVVTPGRCHLPPTLRAWGWAVQLYAARSRSSWGVGDLADLRRLGSWAADEGAGVVGLNPLHASGPALPQQASPYYPSSRCYRNPIFLRIEEVPGAAEAGADIDRLAELGRALNDDRLIDRDRVWTLKREALEACFARFRGDRALDDYLNEHGRDLLRFATYCAIADEHGNGWQAWPEELRRPSSPAVDRYAEEHADRVGFHAWLQWLLDEQLRRASTLPIIQDLAVGFDPGGADAWAWQDLLALDMRVGAPPDEFNTQGQDWGLPPFVPWKLRADAYAPFVQTVRAAFRHAGGLRIDHVMGLFRLFWVPSGGGARDGAYVRYDADELLDIVALESHRAGAFVVGEDLGTVEDHVRSTLAERQVLSYRLLWFEPRPPEEYPEEALAAVTTHDLPTISGMWSGSDLDDQRRAGMSPNEDGEAELRRRLAHQAGVADDAPAEDVIVAAYRALSRAPSRLVLATLDDALCVAERPNMPGTVDEWPNWSIALPKPIEELERNPHVAEVAKALGQDR